MRFCDFSSIAVSVLVCCLAITVYEYCSLKRQMANVELLLEQEKKNKTMTVKCHEGIPKAGGVAVPVVHHQTVEGSSAVVGDGLGGKIVEGIARKSPDDDDDDDSILKAGSSMWCRGDGPSTRHCRFRNICFDPSKKEWIFLHGPESIVAGLLPSNVKMPLVDLSSIEDHNVLQMTLADLPVDAIAEYYTNISLIKDPALLVHRFKPDNLMHVFHDDLMPVHATLQQICGGNVDLCPKDLRIVYIDAWVEGGHWELYQLFTMFQPLALSSMPPDTLYCFEDAYVGLSRQTVWYQYGFVAPQGAWANRTVTGRDVRRFTKDFDSMAANFTQYDCKEIGRYAILFARSSTRLVLNEDELMSAITASTGLAVKRLSLDEHPLMDIIAYVRCADVLIGVHGALLILAMFLPAGAALIELFPYAIPAEQYTPYKTLASIPGLGLAYRAWENQAPENSVAHPDWPSDIGGIAHLSEPERLALLENVPIPPHLCCHNPSWLYYIYQDTIVDTSSFLRVLNEALADNVDEHSQQLLFPAAVTDLKCKSVYAEDQEILVRWQQPWNIASLHAASIDYEVWSQRVGDTDYQWVTTAELEHYFRFLPPAYELNVWVRCRTDTLVGPFKWVACKTNDKVVITY